MAEDSDGRNEDNVSSEKSTKEAIEANVEEQRKENLAHAEFKDCEQIRRAGDLYQDSECETPRNSIELVSERFGIDQEDATRLLSVYTRIFTEMSGEASGYADTVGREYFEGGTIEKIAEDNDRTPDEIREGIREFVGAYIKNHDEKKVDLNQPLPDHPYEPYRELLNGLPDITDSINTFQVPKLLPNIEPMLDIMPAFKLNFDFPIESLHFDIMHDDFQKSIEQTLSIFEEANLQFEDEFVQTISQEVESPPDNWEAYSVVNDIGTNDEESETSGTHENYEEEGSKAVAQLSSIDREVARELYLRFWDASRAATKSMGAQISDGRVAVIAVISTVLFLYTGNFGAAVGSMYVMLDKVSNISSDGESPT